jgi:hypothetical protein
MSELGAVDQVNCHSTSLEFKPFSVSIFSKPLIPLHSDFKIPVIEASALNMPTPT